MRKIAILALIFSSIIYGDPAHIVSSDIEGWRGEYLEPGDTGFIINLYDNGDLWIGNVMFYDTEPYWTFSPITRYRKLVTFDISGKLDACVSYEGLAYYGVRTDVGYISMRDRDNNLIAFPVRLLDMNSRRYRVFIVKVRVTDLSLVAIDTVRQLIIPPVFTDGIYEAPTDTTIDSDSVYKRFQMDEYPIIYPNPLRDGKYFIDEKIKDIQIFDVLGHKVMECVNRKTNYINLSSGRYIVVGKDYNGKMYKCKVSVVK